MREILRSSQATLAAAGVASPRNDAQLIAAELLDIEPLAVPMFRLTDLPEDNQAEFLSAFASAIQRRAERIPLQHILGKAWFGQVELAVGPGVFVPRPETELMAEWAVSQLKRRYRGEPLVVVDMCTGSGAIAAYIAAELFDANLPAAIHAVEMSPEAAAYAKTNLERWQVEVIIGDAGDIATYPPELISQADLVISNPPYVPETLELDPEVYHDPHMAVFAGTTGMTVIPRLAGVVDKLCAPGGLTAIEHDDTTQPAVIDCLAEYGFAQVVGHNDFAGRPRFVTATKL